MPPEAEDLAALPLPERRAALAPKRCRPLPTASVAISFALERFHASWTADRTTTPTYYAIVPEGYGAYVTLGRLRRRFELDWAAIEAMHGLFATESGATGFLVASAAVGGEPPRALFGLQGQEVGERHYGALDLRTLRPHDHAFSSELDLSGDAWAAAWQEAVTNSGIARHAISR